MTQRIKRMRTKRERQEVGFTLIELLVVIIILGVLSAVVVFAVRGSGDKGRLAASVTDAKTMRAAQESYCANNGEYADTQQKLVDAKFLSEPSTLHDVEDVPGGPCGGESLVITCNPTNPVCGQDGTVPDGNFDGSAATATGTWMRTGNLPAGANGGSMVTMSNGKVLMWGNKGGTPPRCPSPGHASCYGSGTGLTYGDWTPGPISIYDPATATWSAAPPLPNRPAWDPLVSASLTNITGTAAECGANCGKVLVQANVGGGTTGNYRLVAPNYRSQDVFLFDPVALTWISVDPPPSIILGQGQSAVQILCGSRPAGSDCGKLMIVGFGVDGNGYAIGDLTPPQTRRDYDAPQYQAAVFDPVDASWGTTASPTRRIANNGAFDPVNGANIGTGQTPVATFAVTDPAGGFRTSDVGMQIFASKVSGSSGWIGANTFITAVSGCTGVNCTTASLSRMSDNGNYQSTAVAQTDDIFRIFGGGLSNVVPLGNVPGQPPGRLVAYSGMSSSVFDPVAKTWTLATQQNTVTPPARNISNVALPTATTNTPAGTNGPPWNKNKKTVTITPTQALTTPFRSRDHGSLVTSPDLPSSIVAGTRVVQTGSTTSSVLSDIPTTHPTPTTVTLTMTPYGPYLGQVSTYACSGSPDEPLFWSTPPGARLTLADGRVMALAANANCPTGQTKPANTLLFDPTTNTWGTASALCPCAGTATPGVVRLGPASGNKVLMVYAADQGTVGQYPASVLGAADGSSWTTITSTFTRRALNSDGTPRTGTSSVPMTLLPTGQVLMAGGTKCNPNVALATCSNTANPVIPQTDTWIYTPPVG